MTQEQQQKRIDELERRLANLENAAELPPFMIQAMGLQLVQNETGAVSDYQKQVNEAGSANYTVAKNYDGIIKIGGKMFGYYDEV